MTESPPGPNAQVIRALERVENSGWGEVGQESGGVVPRGHAYTTDGTKAAGGPRAFREISREQRWRANYSSVNYNTGGTPGNIARAGNSDFSASVTLNSGPGLDAATTLDEVRAAFVAGCHLTHYNPHGAGLPQGDAGK